MIVFYCYTSNYAYIHEYYVVYEKLEFAISMDDKPIAYNMILFRILLNNTCINNICIII